MNQLYAPFGSVKRKRDPEGEDSDSGSSEDGDNKQKIKRVKKDPLICYTGNEVYNAHLGKGTFVLSRQLQELTLTFTGYQTTGRHACRRLAYALRHENNSLKKLALASTSPDGLRHMLHALRENKTIQTLTIAHTKMETCVTELKRIIENNTVTNLTLKRCVTIDDLLALQDTLISTSSLTTLTLSDNELDSHTVIELMAELPSTTSRINLRSTIESSNKTVDTDKQLSIKELDIQGVNSVCSFKTLLPLNLKFNKTLECLFINDLDMDTAMVEHIADIIQENSTIHCLHIQGCCLDDESISILARGLAANNQILELCLDINNIKDEGMKVLAQVIAHHSTMEYLCLSENDFQLPGLQYLVNALQTNKSLKTLILKDMDFDEEAEKLFSIENLNANKTLTSIRYGRDDIVPQCIVQFLERNKSTAAEHSISLTKYIMDNNWNEVTKIIENQSKYQIEHLIEPEALSLQKLHEVNQFACKILENKISNISGQVEDLSQKRSEAVQAVTDLKAKQKALQQELDQMGLQLQYKVTREGLLKTELQKKENMKTEFQELLKVTKQTLVKYQEEMNTWKKILDIKLSEWTKEDVVLLLREIKLTKYSQAFLNSTINGSILIHLTSSDLTDFGMSFKEVKQLQKAIFQLQYFQSLTATPDALAWTVDEVKKWLDDNGFNHLVAKINKLKIDGGDLLFMDRHDFAKELQVNTLADKVKLEQAVKDLKEQILKKYMKIKVKKENLNTDDDADSIYKCPITKVIMTDPVTADDGYTYERKAIEEWIDQHGTSPQTNEPLSRSALRTSLSMKKAIERFKYYEAYLTAQHTFETGVH